MADGSRLRHTGRRSRANEGINKATVPRNRRAAMFVSSAAMRRGCRAQELANELVALQPDVIVAHTVSVAAALKHETSAIPIVFVSVGDPLGAGFIASLARPGGTLTGLMTFEAGISGKWVEMAHCWRRWRPARGWPRHEGREAEGHRGSGRKSADGVAKDGQGRVFPAERPVLMAHCSARRLVRPCQ